MVKAWEQENEDDYIDFTLFDTEEKAKNYLQTIKPNAVLYLFSLINGETSSRIVEHYNSVVVEYDQKLSLNRFKLDISILNKQKLPT